MIDTTVIIKTFERPNCLSNLVRSLRTYYPKIPVYIADDGKHRVTITQPQTTVFTLPFDSGLSVGRNYLLDQVQTPYFLLLDDDYLFTEQTRIEVLHKILTTHKYDIVGGHVYNIPYGPFRFEGNIHLANDALTVHRNQFHAVHLDHVVCDIIPNFFLGNTATVKTVRWDPQLKLCEHVDFFLRAMGKLKVAYCPTVVINHDRKGGSVYYHGYRERIAEFREIFKAKHKLVSVRTLDPPNINTDPPRHPAQHGKPLTLTRRGWQRGKPTRSAVQPVPSRSRSLRLRP